MPHDLSSSDKPQVRVEYSKLSILQELHHFFNGWGARLSVRFWRTFLHISDEDWAELQAIGLSPGSLPATDGQVTRIVPIGVVPLSSLYAARDVLFDTFVHSVQVTEPMLLPVEVYSQQRQQCSAYKLIKRLETYLQPDTFRVIGLVNADLYIPGTNFIFGTGIRDSRAIIIGLKRLTPPDWADVPEKSTLLAGRVATLVVSQVGAGLGLGPCDNDGCARSPATSLHVLDRKCPILCRTCAARVSSWLKPVRSLSWRPPLVSSDCQEESPTLIP